MITISSPNQPLTILLSGESPEDLAAYSTLEELLQVYAPHLKSVVPHTIEAKTGAPIFKYKNLYWWFPNYLEVDPLEYLRANGRLTLPSL